MMVERGKPEVRFHRELRQNYLMIAAEEELEQRFEARMLAGNTIDGLLQFRVRREDDRLWFCYEITSRQPLSRLLERTGMTASQIRRLLLGIAQTLTRMEDYLLDETMVLLDPDFIYMDSVEFRPEICLIPGRKGDFPGEFSEFLQFLLGKTDHQDKEAVMLTYGLYQESLKDNYGLNDLLRWLMKEDCSELEYMYMNGQENTLLPERGVSDGKDPEPQGSIDATDPMNTAARKFKPAPEPGGLSCFHGSRAPVTRCLYFHARRAPVTLCLYWALLPILAVIVLWLWRGMTGIVRYGAVVIGGATGLAAVGAVVSVLCRLKRSLTGDRRHILEGGIIAGNGPPEFAEGLKRKNRDGNRSKRNPPQAQFWEMVFEEPDSETESQTPVFTEREAGEQHLREPPRPSPEDITHTALLRPAAPRTELRRLSGIEGTAETIPVSYYPFLIGKQESLADYVLREDTVSRLHARIDRRGETYWVTDLNSTNGTAVNGTTLEANETVQIHAGDRIDLADLHFKFE